MWYALALKGFTPVWFSEGTEDVNLRLCCTTIVTVVVLLLALPLLAYLYTAI